MWIGPPKAAPPSKPGFGHTRTDSRSRGWLLHPPKLHRDERPLSKCVFDRTGSQQASDLSDPAARCHKLGEGGRLHDDSPPPPLLRTARRREQPRQQVRYVRLPVEIPHPLPCIPCILIQCSPSPPEADSSQLVTLLQNEGEEALSCTTVEGWGPSRTDASWPRACGRKSRRRCVCFGGRPGDGTPGRVCASALGLTLPSSPYNTHTTPSIT